jgi:hypothetical protein
MNEQGEVGTSWKLGKCGCGLSFPGTLSAARPFLTWIGTVSVCHWSWSYYTRDRKQSESRVSKVSKAFRLMFRCCSEPMDPLESQE